MFKALEEIGLFECDILVGLHNFEGSDMLGLVLACCVDCTEVAIPYFFQYFVFAIYLHLYSYLYYQ